MSQHTAFLTQHRNPLALMVTFYVSIMLIASTTVLAGTIFTDVVAQYGVDGWILTNLFYLLSGTCLFAFIATVKIFSVGATD